MNHLVLYAIAVVVVLTIGLALYFATQPSPTPAPVTAAAAAAAPTPAELFAAATPSMFTMEGDYIDNGLAPRSINKLYKMNDGTLVTTLADDNFYKLSVVGNSGIAKGLTPNTSYYLNYPNAETSPEPVFGDLSSFDKFKDSSSLGNAAAIGNHYETKCADSSKSLDNYCVM